MVCKVLGDPVQGYTAVPSTEYRMQHRVGPSAACATPAVHYSMHSLNS